VSEEELQSLDQLFAKAVAFFAVVLLDTLLRSSELICDLSQVLFLIRGQTRLDA
jgi:hypothetical protein